jgi:hypothetical protein
MVAAQKPSLSQVLAEAEVERARASVRWPFFATENCLLLPLML